MPGLFITFEGTEGSGKSTQLTLLSARLQELGRRVRTLREPGGTTIGEEIRHTLKHSVQGRNMTPEAELLLMNASRAQLVREVIRPALAGGELVLCDRFYDSTTAYQGYGRGLNLNFVRSVIDFAVGSTRPDLTLFLHVPLAVSEARRRERQVQLAFLPDRIEAADREFFKRVERGYRAIAAAEPKRVREVDGVRGPEAVSAAIWKLVAPLLARPDRKGRTAHSKRGIGR